MRVVLDSSVMVAAFTTHGVCHELFEYCLKNTTIFSSDYIADEIERILIQKIKIPAKKTSAIIHYLKSHTEWIVPEKITVEGLRDPKDQMVIIATALSADADYLITGDKDMLVLKMVKKTIILTPRDFWIHCQL